MSIVDSNAADPDTVWSDQFGVYWFADQAGVPVSGPGRSFYFWNRGPAPMDRATRPWRATVGRRMIVANGLH
jgi:hypothetical protein